MALDLVWDSIRGAEFDLLRGSKIGLGIQARRN